MDLSGCVLSVVYSECLLVAPVIFIVLIMISHLWELGPYNPLVPSLGSHRQVGMACPCSLTFWSVVWLMWPCDEPPLGRRWQEGLPFPTLSARFLVICLLLPGSIRLGM